MKQVIVVGRSRSGTSLTAGMLHRLGIKMGNDDGKLHDSSNPKGAFEDGDWISITMNMELAISTNDQELMDRQRQRVRDIVKKRDETNDIWGFKSAVTYRVIEHLMPFFSSPGIVYVFRNPYDTALSEAKFSHNQSLEYTDKLKELKIPAGLRNSGDFLFACERIMNTYRDVPHTYVTFENIRSDPIKVLTQLSGFTEQPITEDIIQSVTEFVLPKYCSWEVKKDEGLQTEERP